MIMYVAGPSHSWCMANDKGLGVVWVHNLKMTANFVMSQYSSTT